MHAGTENIYRINSLREVEHSSQPWAVSPLPLAEAALTTIPAIEQVARLYQKSIVVKKNDNTLNETIHYADPGIFTFFNFPLKYGDYAGFKENTVVISEAFAGKYFGNEMPVGKELILLTPGGKEEVRTVGAVMHKMPLNCSFQFDLVAPLEELFTYGTLTRNNWKSGDLITAFVKVAATQNTSQIEKQLNNYRPIHNTGREDWKINGFYLQPFKNIAFSSDRDFDGYVYGSPLMANPRGVIVIVPAVMSLFILLITCFNFTNISIAFASRRLKEIGIRKVLGGIRLQLIKQFLTENLILSFFASLLAIAAVHLLLPLLNNLSGLELQVDYTGDPALWAILLLLPALAAILSGLYPAVYISSFQPVKVLKGTTVFGSSNRFTRFLLTAQFSISCLALITGIILTQNAAYQQQVDFGYDINKVAVVEITNAEQYAALKNVASNHPGIESIAGTAQQIGDGSYQVTAAHHTKDIKAQVAHTGGKAYFETMGLRLKEGRHFHGETGVDSEQSIIVNQTLVNALQLQQPVGEQLKIQDKYFTIVGVVNDYKEFGLHGLVPPCILRLAKAEEYKVVVVRAEEKNLAEVNQFLQASWQKVAPGLPFKGFLQSELTTKEKYLNEGFQAVAFFLAMVTILLSASGLFALVSLNVIRRSKEIGIRKVLGASVWQMILFINKDFIRLMLVAFVMGSALGYLFINNLLFRFIYVYHPQVGPQAFMATFLLLMLSCALTVGVKVYGAASANP
jgi:ABC-type antimicrobial peptide transport system permease subunit